MGYSVHEWFDDFLAPKLKEVMDVVEKNKTEKEEETIDYKDYKFPYDLFIDAIKSALMEHSDDRFVAGFLSAVLNPEDEDMDIGDIIKAVFNKYTCWNNEGTLSKLEYRKDAATTVTVNYQDFEKEED